MKMFHPSSCFASLIILVIYAPVSVYSQDDPTGSFSLGPGNDAIIPFTAQFNDALMNTSISMDAGHNSAPGTEIAALSSSIDFMSSTWIGIAVDNFTLNFDIAFGLLSSGNGTNTLAYPLKTFDPQTVTILDVLDISLDIKIEFFAQVNTTLETDFSIGFNVKMLNPAGLVLVLPGLDSVDSPSDVKNLPDTIATDLDQAVLTGFDSSNFVITPLFNTTSPSPEFVFELAIRTVLKLTADALDVSETLATINLDMPAYTITAHQVEKVDYLCNPATSTTPADQVYTNLTHVTEEITTDANYDLIGGDPHSLFNVDIYNVTSRCMAFFPALGFQQDAPKETSTVLKSQSPGGLTGLIHSARHLSKGAIAGIVIAAVIVIGAIIGVSIWFWKRNHQRPERRTTAPSWEQEYSQGQTPQMVNTGWAQKEPMATETPVYNGGDGGQQYAAPALYPTYGAGGDGLQQYPPPASFPGHHGSVSPASH